MCLELT